MSYENCDAKEEGQRINENGETSSSANQTKSTTNYKSRRSQKISWIPSPEEETYRTVVVNYRYAKMDKNYPRNTGAISKKKHWNRKMMSMTARKNSDEDEDEEIPNLRKLYDCSKEDLCIYKTPDTPMPSCENIAASRTEPTKEAIKLEVYCMPMEQEAKVEEPQLNTIEESEVESATLRGEECNDDEVKSLSYPSCTDFVLLQDNEIGETPDFDADFCCAMTENKVDGTQQTCIIKNTTKATQNPERHNERLQTARSSRMRTTGTSNIQNDENRSQLLTVAEIPKDSSKSKSTPTQGGFRQRQQELHRYRIAVEQKRLELLNVKLQRERDEMLREQILFEKELEFKATQLGQLNDDKIVDIM